MNISRQFLCTEKGEKPMSHTYFWLKDFCQAYCGECACSAPHRRKRQMPGGRRNVRWAKSTLPLVPHVSLFEAVRQWWWGGGNPSVLPEILLRKTCLAEDWCPTLQPIPYTVEEGNTAF
ncbi:hypothetical protein GJAV_G00062890 [Gymnothorax javanicus]|nr:hypothetical protein GJAV_G00062890 [Gymnothorax javanicus]